MSSIAHLSPEIGGFCSPACALCSTVVSFTSRRVRVLVQLAASLVRDTYRHAVGLLYARDPRPTLGINDFELYG